MCLKFTSPGFTGVPDRLVLMPGGKVWFCEMKSTGWKMTDRQEYVKGQLQALEFPVFVIDTVEKLNGFLNAI